MPLDKRDLQEDENTLTLTKAMWMIALALIAVVLMAFAAGIAVHYIVEFFEAGWNLVA